MCAVCQQARVAPLLQMARQIAHIAWATCVYPCLIKISMKAIALSLWGKRKYAAMVKTKSLRFEFQIAGKRLGIHRAILTCSPWRVNSIPCEHFRSKFAEIA